MAYTKGSRYVRVPGDNQEAITKKQILVIPYTTTVAISNLDCEINKVHIKTMTGAMTVTADVTNPYSMDKMIVILSADTSNRVATFGTGFIVSGTVTCLANKVATVEFYFDPILVVWVEKNRFVQS